MLINKTMDIEEVLTRGVEQVLPDKEELKKLMQEKQITLYQGFDPSMPSLHLGHLVGVMKLAQFQKLGHKIIFLIGDFTGMIGDPDKISTRVPLTREQTLENSKNWKDQISNIIEFKGDNPAQTLFNSQWNDKISFKELLEITSQFTVQQILERDMFQKRLEENRPIRLHELLYPVTQAIDSIKMIDGGVDLEIGGHDQLFNILAGRDLMKNTWNKEKHILTTKLLVDKEGNKVGKTTGNALFLDSSPDEFYGGIMSFPDETIYLGFELLTEVELDGLSEKINSDPMGEKKALAWEIVKNLRGEDNANKAKESFESTFQKGELPNIEIEVSDKIMVDAVAGVVGSKSEAKRLLAQKAIEVDGIVVEDQTYTLTGGEVIKIGKKQFVKVKGRSE